MSTIELPEAATLQIDIGDGCAPGQWTAVAHVLLDASAEQPTLGVSLDARDGGLPLDVALATDDGALYAYTANAHEGEPAAETVVIEIVRLLAKVGG